MVTFKPSGLDLATAPAGVAGDRGGVGVGALALTQIAQHGRVDGDLLGHAGGAFGEVEPHPQQGIGARTHASDRAAGRATPGVWPR